MNKPIKDTIIKKDGLIISIKVKTKTTYTISMTNIKNFKMKKVITSKWIKAKKEITKFIEGK